ncbi:MAG: hypothetical protein AB8B60_10950 [Sulfitobacter sp.]
MSDSQREYAIIEREVLRLSAEVVRMQAEYDLTDGVDDEEEKAEIDAFVTTIEGLQERQAALTAAGVGAAQAAIKGDAEPIVIIPSDQIDYYDDDLQRFFGTRMAAYGSRCSQAILGARGELNVDVPSKGFTSANLFDVVRITPGSGLFAPVTKALTNLMIAYVETMDVSPGRSFVDIGNDLSSYWINYQKLMSEDSTERQDEYHEFVKAFRGSDDSDTVSRNLIHREIETFVAGMTEAKLVARAFLLKCFECLDDPWIELDSLWEEEGYETGDVSLNLHLRDNQFSLASGYIDDAPGALVKALTLNFGRETSCVDLPLAIRINVVVFFKDRGHPREQDEEFNVSFEVRRLSREIGNQSFSFNIPGASYPDMEEALINAKAAFEAQKPYLGVKLGQLGGD